MADEKIYGQVQDHYGSAVLQGVDIAYGAKVASAFGYSAEELVDVPEGANLGLSCGNPLAMANLREGETVVDLGSGAGFDVFQASKKIGHTGHAIGVDMNLDMLKKANEIKHKTKSENVSFVESRISEIQLPSESTNCIISNCVINLVPDSDKPKVFEEMHRLLKPGGRVAISDILAKGPLPEHIRNDIALYVGCISGASQVQQYETWLHAAGFKDILISDTKSDLNIYGDGQKCCGPTSKRCCGSEATEKRSDMTTVETQEAKEVTVDFNEFAGSYKIYAVKQAV